MTHDPTHDIVHQAGPDTTDVRGIGRRAVLGLVGGGLVTAATAAPAAAAVAAFANTPFANGVASGEPDSDSVVLWTRVAPKPHRVDMGMDGRPDSIDVTLQVRRAGETGWSGGIALQARRSAGYTVKHIVSGLAPNRRYEYRFKTPGWSGSSPVGTTRTLPGDSATRDIRFALLSCMSLGQDGRNPRYFNGLQHLHERTGADEVDFVVHIGDYIYEFPINGEDAADGAYAGQCRTLGQYRARYGTTRNRVHLRKMHQKLAMFAVPDDHEVWNNVHGGAGNLGGTTSTRTEDRYNKALQAWWEMQPTRASFAISGAGRAELRRPDNASLGLRIRCGSVMDLLLVDTRLQRTNQGGANPTILGSSQRDWLLPKIENTSRTWCVLATGVPFARVSSDDKWSGYTDDRFAVGKRLRGRKNAVVLSGDIHRGTVVNARSAIDGTQKVVATEFVGPPVSSDSSSSPSAGGDVKAVYNDRWGYLLCVAAKDHFYARFCMTTDVLDSGATVTEQPRWKVAAGAAKGSVSRA